MKKITAVLTAVLILLSMTVPLCCTVAAEAQPLTNLYNEDYYEFYGNSKRKTEFDTENKTISVDGINKAMINYTDDMTDFEASVKMQCNAKGATYAGFAFHLSSDDFKTHQFNTEGYSVIIKNNSETNNYKDVKVIVRYVTAGTIKNGETVKTYSNVYTAADPDRAFIFTLKVQGGSFTMKLTDANTGKGIFDGLSYPLDNRASKPDSGYYEKGNFAIISNGVHTFSDFSVISYGNMVNIPAEEGAGGNTPENPLSGKFDLYAEDYFTTEPDGYSTASANARAVLKSGSKDSFSADLPLKLNASGEVKAGIVFRVSSVGVGTDNMQGYALIADTTKDSAIRLYLYKYGPKTGSSANAYIGNVTSYLAVDEIAPTAGKELILHINVSDKKMQAYIYEKNATEIKSETLTGSLDATVKNSAVAYYDSGRVGVYIAAGYYANISALQIKDSEKIEEDQGSVTGGIAAVDTSSGSAVRGNTSSVSNVTASNISAPTVDKLAEYAADFDNYTFYSSSTSNKFVRTDAGLTSLTTGAKRAILDGVTVKGFHSSVTMRIDSEGTLRAGIVFRVNDIEGSLSEDKTLGSNDIQGYAAILYKTPGTTESHARVVLCIYKYGVKNGKHYYLGTVASKASTVPLEGFSKKIADAAGQQLTMDINLIGDDISAYFYNTADPSKRSETLVANLNNTTDIEKSTPSLSGVHYDSGAIGLTATDYVTFTSFTVGEPIYPSNKVGPLSELDSFTIYGSGVTKEGDYFRANSSGTKKMIVNNLTVSDFKASVDMTIDSNGNLKAGFFFRVNNMGNGADDQEGFAAIVSRNYSTNGENNPNRIDIVVFKWGYLNGKLSYLGEVAREAYKSGASFVDGKMAGEELTFIISVSGSVFEATLCEKADPTNKPVTFSTNLKFAATKEKNGAAYFESGGVGLYLGNSVSDPVNNTKMRNFHIDDGSGVKVMSTAKSKSANKMLGIIPLTGEGIAVMVAGGVLVASVIVLFTVYICNKRGKKEKTGEKS